MKILYIASRYEGGIGGHAKRVAEKLQENGFNVELMKVPHIPIKNLKNPSFAVFGVIKAMAKTKEYDVVHAWNVPSAFVMEKIKTKKRVLAVHGVYGQQVQQIHSKITSKIGKSAEKKALKIADIFTTDSKYVKDFYKNEFDVDFVHLPAPLDTSKFQDIPDVVPKKNQVIYVGRDSYEKGVDILRDIEDRINGDVVYCTDVPWKDAMKKLKESTMLVVPSRAESLPQVIKEAFFLKVPVIAADVGGVSEIVKDKVTGILVPSEDPEKLLESINYLLENPEIAKSLSVAAHDFVQRNFSLEALLPQYVEFYKKMR